MIVCFRLLKIVRVNSQVQTEIHIRHNQYQSKEGERRGDESVRENTLGCGRCAERGGTDSSEQQTRKPRTNKAQRNSAHNKHIFNRWGNRKVI